MASSTKRAAAEELRKSAQTMLDAATRLEKEAKKEELPPIPKSNFWRVDVKFTSYGTTYTYLLVRHGQKWYTTGVDERTNTFASWEKLWEWLEGPDVYAHSRLQKLVHLHGSEEIEYGTKPVLGIQQVTTGPNSLLTSGRYGL